jgi:hypothetical protein
MRDAGQSQGTTADYISLNVAVCEFSGGAVIEPETRDHGVTGYEDNLITSLAKDPSVDALIIVSSDRDLLRLSPAWDGRLVIRPADSVPRVVG